MKRLTGSSNAATAARAESATAALMEHRWKAVREGGLATNAYARALGIGVSAIHRSVNGWELLQARPDLAAHDAYALASMGEVKRAAVKAVAEAKGIGARPRVRILAPPTD